VLAVNSSLLSRKNGGRSFTKPLQEHAFEKHRATIMNCPEELLTEAVLPEPILKSSIKRAWPQECV